MGRGDTCDLVLRDADCSREHAVLAIDEGGASVRDLDSKNGVLVNGKQVRERRLHDRDELRIGATVLIYEDPAEAQARALEEGEDEVAPAPVAPPEPATDPVMEPEPALPPEPEPARVPKPRSIAATDMLVYVLAGLVLAASAVGLLWLLRSG
jgi:pSer/pThr/pTyr-binding forkhead associated (FHA) protein